MAFRASCNRVIFLLAFTLPALACVPVLGINNFYQVDSHVYRGAQPTNEGFEYLARIGVKTVIDLREADERSKAEERVVTAAGMRYLNVPMTGLTPRMAKLSERTENARLRGNHPSSPGLRSTRRSAQSEPFNNVTSSALRS